MHNLAGVLDGQGKYEEAEAMCRQTLAGYEKVLGKYHPTTRACRQHYSQMLASRGQDRLALPSEMPRKRRKRKRQGIKTVTWAGEDGH